MPVLIWSFDLALLTDISATFNHVLATASVLCIYVADIHLSNHWASNHVRLRQDNVHRWQCPSNQYCQQLYALYDCVWESAVSTLWCTAVSSHHRGSHIYQGRSSIKLSSAFEPFDSCPGACVQTVAKHIVRGKSRSKSHKNGNVRFDLDNMQSGLHRKT